MPWLMAGAALVWANGLLAEDAQPASATTTAAANTTSSVPMASDGLPLLIPDDAWKRLTRHWGHIFGFNSLLTDKRPNG